MRDECWRSRCRAAAELRRGELGGPASWPFCARFAPSTCASSSARTATPRPTAATIEIADGVWRTTFTGDFQATPTGYTGTLTGFAQTHDGRRVFEATGVEASADTALGIVEDRDNDRFLAYTLSGDDRILGSRRDDYLIGFGGDDRLRGGGGDDELFGGSGRDEVEGGAGDDFLAGGRGRRPDARRLRRRHLPRRRPRATG